MEQYDQNPAEDDNRVNVAEKYVAMEAELERAKREREDADGRIAKCSEELDRLRRELAQGFGIVTYDDSAKAASSITTAIKGGEPWVLR